MISYCTHTHILHTHTHYMLHTYTLILHTCMHAHTHTLHTSCIHTCTVDTHTHTCIHCMRTHPARTRTHAAHTQGVHVNCSVSRRCCCSQPWSQMSSVWRTRAAMLSQALTLPPSAPDRWPRLVFCENTAAASPGVAHLLLPRTVSRFLLVHLSVSAAQLHSWTLCACLLNVVKGPL